jgi:hypothetical protein
MKIRRGDQRYQPRHGGDRFQTLRRVLRFLGLFAGTLAVVAFFAVTGDRLQATVLGLARDLTGGTDRGMAAAAWAFLHVPIWLFAAALLLLRRRPAVVATGVVSLALLVPMVPFLPARHQRVELHLSGPGAAGFADGLRWAGFALMAIPVISIIAAFHDGASFRRGRQVTESRGTGVCVLIGAAASLGALITAVTVAG